MSDLHRSNLEALRKKNGMDDDGGLGSNGQNYRDRAKERREKYGQTNNPPSNKLKVGLVSFMVGGMEIILEQNLSPIIE